VLQALQETLEPQVLGLQEIKEIKEILVLQETLEPQDYRALLVPVPQALQDRLVLLVPAPRVLQEIKEIKEILVLQD
jgi:hypothetical protein